MKGWSLSRRVGLVVAVVTLLLMTLFFYESARRVYWLQLGEHLDQLEELTHRFSQDLSLYLSHITEIEDREKLECEDRFLEIHFLLQPLVEEIRAEEGPISLGYYSKEIEAIVAIAPLSEHQDLLGSSLDDQHPSLHLYTDRPMQRNIGHVMRGKVARYAKLVFYKGEPIGHIWANLPVSVFYKSLFPFFLLFLMLALLGLGLGGFLSCYLSKSILKATEMLGDQIDVLGNEELDHTTLSRSSHQNLPLEFHPLFERFFVSAEKIKDLTVELTISSRLAALGDLVTVVAHDIRNPLSLILARAQIGAQKTYDEESKKYFEGIIEASKMIDSFLERILLLARVDTCNKRRFSIAAILLDLLDLWGPLMKEKEMQLEVNISQDLPEVMGDPVGFQQAFLNLFKNAIEATSKGGAIMVRAEQIDEVVCIAISDTGAGIPEEAQGEIFKRFFTTKKTNGSGIGLAMAHSVITGQGGQIWFETRRGKGTTFYIEFPVAPFHREEISSEALLMK